MSLLQRSAVFLFCLIGAFGFFIRLSTSAPDTQSYFDAANRLAMSWQFGSEYFFWPPLYPSLLAMGRLCGADLALSAKLLNSVLASILCVMLATHLRRALTVAGSLGSACFLVFFSNPISFVFDMALSDALFMVILFAQLLFFSKMLAYGQTRDYWVSSILLGLAMLTRHVGILLLFSCLLTFAVSGLSQRARKWNAWLVWAGIPCVIYSLWLLRTFFLRNL